MKVAVERDTDKDPFDWQTVASKGLLLTGNAVLAACDDLLSRAYADAAQVLRAQTADLDHDHEKIFIKQRPEESVTFASLSIGYVYPNGNGIGGPLIGLGRYIAQGLTSLDKETGQGLPALDWTYGAHGVIAEVDPDTGEYKVIKIASAFDVGKVINPGTMRGQCIGGMIQGLGTAECESYIYDDQGHLLNPSLTDNKILTAKDLPEEIECIAVETPQLDGPFGARWSWRAPDDLGGTSACQRHPRRDGRRSDAHAGPLRGRVASNPRQPANRHLGHQGTARLDRRYSAERPVLVMVCTRL